MNWIFEVHNKYINKRITHTLLILYNAPSTTSLLSLYNLLASGSCQSLWKIYIFQVILILYVVEQSEGELHLSNTLIYLFPPCRTFERKKRFHSSEPDLKAAFSSADFSAKESFLKAMLMCRIWTFRTLATPSGRVINDTVAEYDPLGMKG